MGGGLSVNPFLGVRLGAFVEPEVVHEVWTGVVSIFRDYGYRRLRTRARLKFLVKAWGVEKFRRCWRTTTWATSCRTGPPRSWRRETIAATT